MVKGTINRRGGIRTHTELNQDQLYVTVDLLVMTIRQERLTLLLSRRTNPPYASRWALPGHFIGMEDSAEKTAENLLKEMLPVRPYLEQLYTFSALNRDPRGRVISVAYLALAPFKQLESVMARQGNTFAAFQVATDREELLLTGESGEELTETDLAFDHGKIIRTGVRRLQGKLDYTDIGFAFLENQDAFTLTELQTVHEAVMGTKFDKSNFRRQIQNRYIRSGQMKSTDMQISGGQGRPAGIYRKTRTDDSTIWS